MNSKALLLSAAIGLVLAGTASAGDKKNNFMIVGPGANSCMQVLEELRDGVEKKNPTAQTAYSVWLAGDLTAFNRGMKNTYSILGKTEFMDAFKWTLDYCKNNPMSTYGTAVDRLILKLQPSRFQTMPIQSTKQPEPTDKDDSDDDSDN